MGQVCSVNILNQRDFVFVFIDPELHLISPKFKVGFVLVGEGTPYGGRPG